MNRCRQRIATGLIAAATLTVALCVPGTAMATPVPGIPVTPAVPLLRVTMSDGVTAPKSGGTLAYAVTVIDRDTVALPMDVRLAAPENLHDITVGDGGTLTGRELSWPASLTPGRAVTVHFTAKVGDDSMRLATTACAYLSGSDRPTACASDLDEVMLPGNGVGWGSIVGSAVLVVLAGAAVYALRRRRGHTAGSPEQNAPAHVPDAREAVSDDDIARV